MNTAHACTHDGAVSCSHGKCCQECYFDKCPDELQHRRIAGEPPSWRQVDDLRTRLAASEQARERAAAEVKRLEGVLVNYWAHLGAIPEDDAGTRLLARLAAAEKVVEAAREDGACRNPQCIKHPGDKGYYEWARSLTLGDIVEVVDPDRYKDPDVAAIARMTPTQYLLADGRRYRRVGACSGYRVGEDGSKPRTYIVAVPQGGGR